MPVNTEYLSTGTTILSNISLNSNSDATISAVALRIPSGPVLRSGALDLRTNTAVLSLDTRADATSMTIGQLRLVFAASGISLVYSSGASVYIIGGSATSGAQA